MSDITITSKKNMNCWNCDHFQRYDPGEEPEAKFGECRRIAPKGDLVENDGFQIFWPIIDDSAIFWCGDWEASVEKNLPDPPEEGAELDFNGSIINWEPWNKKAPENVMCWNCDHFQRNQDEGPGTRPIPLDEGECRRHQPLPWLSELRFGNGQYLGVRKVLKGIYWCGEWQKALHEVPPMPEVPFQEPPGVVLKSTAPKKNETKKKVKK